MSEFDIRQFEALLAVGESGSVAAAARQLGWSQPTVNHHLAKLAAIVGRDVVERRATGTVLTPIARGLEPRMREVLQLCDEMTDELELRANRRGLRLGMFPTVGSIVLPSVVRELRAHAIDVQATFAEVSDLVPKLQRDELDAAILYSVHGHALDVDRRWRVSPLVTDPFVLALPAQHELATVPQIGIAHLRELSDEGWVVGTTPGDATDLAVEQWCAKAGFQPRVALRTDNYRVSMSMIAAGLAIGVVSSTGVRTPPEGVVRVPIADRSLARDVTLVTRAPWSNAPIIDTIRDVVIAQLRPQHVRS